MERVPTGVVERGDDGFVGRCDEFGITVEGQGLEETFVNLNAAIAHAMKERAASDGVSETTPPDVTYFSGDDADPNSAVLAVMTAMLVDGLGDYAPLEPRKIPQ